MHSCVTGIYRSKALTRMKFSCMNKKCFLLRRQIPFCHIVVWTIYTCCIDHFTHQHTAFEQSTACLSVFLESLPDLIPFAIL